jgi:hypothetical protein
MRFSSEPRLSQIILIDTNIVLDHILPQRRQDFPCSESLLRNLVLVNCEAWLTDYALAESLGELKSNLEKKLGIHQVKSQGLSPQQISGLENIVNQILSFPHLHVFRSPNITQKEIYDVVRKACVQAKDALLIVSVEKLRLTYPKAKLVTRDEKLLSRAPLIVDTVYPSEILGKCPLTCKKMTCLHRI